VKANLIELLEKSYSKLPNLSPQLQEFVARIIPGFTLFFGLLIALASVLDFLGSPLTTLFTLSGPSVIQQLLLRSVLGIAQGIMMVFAFSPLKRRHQKGWKLLFWSQILWIISAAVTLNPAIILGFLILYPLFKVRHLYNQ
jgi:hypothetical protein